MSSLSPMNLWYLLDHFSVDSFQSRTEPEEPVSITTVKSDQNGNNSGFSTNNSDSAIDINSVNITNDLPSFQSTPMKSN